MYEVRIRKPRRKAVYLKYWDKFPAGAINIKEDLSVVHMETVPSSNRRDKDRKLLRSNTLLKFLDIEDSIGNGNIRVLLKTDHSTKKARIWKRSCKIRWMVLR
jgi:hypothetical protein